MLVRRTMVREVFPTFQQGVEVPSCCERAILRYGKGTLIQGNGSVHARVCGREGGRGMEQIGHGRSTVRGSSHFGYFICGSYTCDNFLSFHGYRREKKEQCENNLKTVKKSSINSEVGAAVTPRGVPSARTTPSGLLGDLQCC